MKVAFLDRDGTIIQDYPDEQWRGRTKPEFLPGAKDGLRELQHKGYSLIIITNQYLINEGIITLSEYTTLTEAMLAELRESNVRIVDVLFCPHRRDEGCGCRKPRPGMVKQALEKYPLIDLNESILVGDSPADMELAVTLGLRGFALTPSAMVSHERVAAARSLEEVARSI